NKIIDILRSVNGSSIVYCNSRKQTKELAQLLNLEQISADFFHAGLTQEIRKQKQENWIHNQTRVMVCTNAFGMGIDKPDVRTVIHHDIPDSLESYYQEAGRAGRDGRKAYAVLIYRNENLSALQEMADKRFPPIPEIKRIYQALADYLQIPVGIGEGQYFDFDLFDFTKNFSLDTLQVVHTLKVLEQEGHITFSESIFLPAQVNFICSKEQIHLFEENYPEYEPLIKCLLRSYEGIFDNRVSVYEKQLARLCRITIEDVSKQLKQLQSFGIIEYLPQKDTPQIHFIWNRASAKYLQIHQDRYLERKKIYAARVDNMIAYVNLKDECRSRFISNYFGDTEWKDCGICDNCLDKKRKALSPGEFQDIQTRIDQGIQQNTSLEQLFRQLSVFNRDKIWTVLEFLQQEGLIHIDETGTIKKSKPI
ncbi:MAG: RecQ family ATP-dependent DNA helicase, partial [Bacteroidota bacterium]|nr:RecQ family ATP-dependent DNA helicase [Bacteroidota bacterium]